jgi:hypothetical protein
MSSDPYASLDQTVLDMIEHSPTGAVPHTPTYQDALRRLYASHQVYASADYKDGHVTVRSLTTRPIFMAVNLAALRVGDTTPDGLEPNAAIFGRYVHSLPIALQARAETFRSRAVGRPVLHRKHSGAGEIVAIHDPVHSLFLVPGTGPRHGLPGNYLYGVLLEIMQQDSPSRWVVQLHDAEDGAASAEAGPLATALDQIEEVLASAPFHLSELKALGFSTN